MNRRIFAGLVMPAVAGCRSTAVSTAASRRSARHSDLQHARCTSLRHGLACRNATCGPAKTGDGSSANLSLVGEWLSETNSAVVHGGR
jgi:hypothetical protein